MSTTLEKSHSLGNRVELEKFWFEKINTFLKARYIDRVSFFQSERFVLDLQLNPHYLENLSPNIANDLNNLNKNWKRRLSFSL